ncbi:cysteine-rich motor neuron 1 protein-like [Diadema antillarum]|uniref:cysteine-rich motor neuron 1 protein-like n=1 Tax=Diadema antillarum TaxID=105358 RepID=UPI003A87DCF2
MLGRVVRFRQERQTLLSTIVTLTTLAAVCQAQDFFSLSLSSNVLLLPCVYRGIPYLHGESWKVDECTTCNCDNATTTCVIESCQPAFCKNPIKPEGECCYICPDEQTPPESDGETGKGDNTEDSFSLSLSGNVPLLPCVYRGIPYLHGESWKVDECTTCNCDNATTTCVIESCQPIFCKNPIKPEGECCYICPDEQTPPESDGETGKGDNTEDSFSLSLSGNVPLLPCVYRGSPYLHGESWKVDECTTCNCDNATTTCVIESCQPIFCKNPIKPEGECCYICPDEQTPPESDGETGKGDNTEDSFSLSLSGNVPLLPCVYRGSPYLHGESWKVDECTTCNCDNATTTCVIESCQPIFCKNPIKPEGECCYICPDEQTPPESDGETGKGDNTEDSFSLSLSGNVPLLPCVYRGSPYLHGESWKVDECTTCNCDNATATCVIESCQPAFCKNPIKPEGECCYICPDEQTPPESDGETGKGDNTEEQTPPESDGETGKGDNTEDSFSLSLSGNVPLLPCVYRGSPYLHGESWKVDECTTCNCDNATATCVIESCQPAFCKNPIKPEGECCYICPDEQTPPESDGETGKGDNTEDFFSLSLSSNVLLLPCVYRGIPYLHGESWKVDECTTCNCDNATATCVIESCQPAFCKNAIKPEGECCYICPDEQTPQESDGETGEGDNTEGEKKMNCLA